MQRYYRNKISEYKSWPHRNNASQGLIFPQNIGSHLSLDETCLSQGELYTIITNKAAKGKKGSLVAILKGTQSESIIELVKKIPIHLRKRVKEITLDLAGNMALIAKRCFPRARLVIDRFHVQQLASEALQEIRIKHRWEAIEAENTAIEHARKVKRPYTPEILSNGETLKQLLARSRHLLYKGEHKWSMEQKLRADILFVRYPDIQKAHQFSQRLSWIYSSTTDKVYALTRLAKWCENVAQSGFKSFYTISRTINLNYQRILNYFDNRSTNASAESFNAKIKAFRNQYRGVTDINFFLFRMAKLFA